MMRFVGHLTPGLTWVNFVHLFGRRFCHLPLHGLRATDSHRLGLSVTERNSIDIAASCMLGRCGTGATSVLSGSAEMNYHVGLSSARRGKDLCLLCVGR